MKACRCCNTIVGRLKRGCPSCKVPALWRPLTEQELADRRDRDARTYTLLKEMIERADAEVEAQLNELIGRG